MEEPESWSEVEQLLDHSNEVACNFEVEELHLNPLWRVKSTSGKGGPQAMDAETKLAITRHCFGQLIRLWTTLLKLEPSDALLSSMMQVLVAFVDHESWVIRLRALVMIYMALLKFDTFAKADVKAHQGMTCAGTLIGHLIASLVDTCSPQIKHLTLAILTILLKMMDKFAKGLSSLTSTLDEGSIFNFERSSLALPSQEMSLTQWTLSCLLAALIARLSLSSINQLTDILCTHLILPTADSSEDNFGDGGWLSGASSDEEADDLDEDHTRKSKMQQHSRHGTQAPAGLISLGDLSETSVRGPVIPLTRPGIAGRMLIALCKFRGSDLTKEMTSSLMIRLHNSYVDVKAAAQDASKEGVKVLLPKLLSYSITLLECCLPFEERVVDVNSKAKGSPIKPLRFATQTWLSA
ncbi:hypothetical protein Ciccas_010305, partial [Cichlidogyrus casuarinus]